MLLSWGMSIRGGSRTGARAEGNERELGSDRTTPRRRSAERIRGKKNVVLPAAESVLVSTVAPATPGLQSLFKVEDSRSADNRALRPVHSAPAAQTEMPG